jgi:hypothetical protein
MAWPEIPEHLRHFLDRDGLVVVGKHPIRESYNGLLRTLPTLEHAVRLFDAVAARLGERGIVEIGWNTVDRALYLRDAERPEWRVAVPLLEIALVTRLKAPPAPTTVVGPDGKAIGTKPPPEARPERHVDIAPTGLWARSADFTLRSSLAPCKLGYDERGLHCETGCSGGDLFTWGWLPLEKAYTIDTLARPPQEPPLELFLRDDAPVGWTIDELAELVAAFDLAGRVPLRVRVPAEMPGGTRGAVDRAMRAMRTALFADDAKGQARWIVADGFDGTAVARGDSIDEALIAWQRELFRARPKPPEAKPSAPPPDPPAPEPKDDAPIDLRKASTRAPGAALTTAGTTEHVDAEGKMVALSFGTMKFDFGPPKGAAPPPPPREIRWPPATPANTPGVLVPLGGVPGEIPPTFRAIGFTRWARVLGAQGRVGCVLVREDDRGTLLVGEGVLDLVDPATLDAQLDDAVAKDRAQFQKTKVLLPDIGDPYDDCHSASHHLGVWDEGRRRAVPPVMGGGMYSRSPPKLDPAQLDGDAILWGLHWTRGIVRGGGVSGPEEPPRP